MSSAHEGVGVVDFHAHMFPRDLPDLAARTGDDRWPVLKVGETTSQVMVSGAAYRESPHTMWDVEARVALLDEKGISRQVVSPLPATLVGWAETALIGEWSRAVNQLVSDAISASGGRLIGLGSVPFSPDEELSDVAVAEVQRVVEDPSLVGIEISTLPAGRELDDPYFAPFWAAVAEHRLPVFIHPTDSGATRRRGLPIEFGVGMLTDTALAASALLFGGVLDQHPDLRIALAHGCGTLPWALPRLKLMGNLVGVAPDHADELVRRLWVDSLVFDPEHFRLLVHRFGADHIMVGTDDPLIAGQLDAAPALVRSAVAVGALVEEHLEGVLGGNALTFLGLT